MASDFSSLMIFSLRSKVDGVRVDEVVRRCPEQIKILNSVPQCEPTCLLDLQKK